MANNINIGSHTAPLPTTPKSAQRTGNGGAVSSAAAPPAEPDRVSVTPEAALLQNIERKLGDVPDFNHAKVEEVKAALAAGTFAIDPARVAEKLIAFESGNK